jgi:glycosyltransferase involved in cell wall biosynthesis
MNVTFLMPCYMWGPSGGFRTVYEYANQLVSRGHNVAVVHPRKLQHQPKEPMTLRKRLRKARLWVTEISSTPSIYWHSVDPRVRLLYVSRSDPKNIPDAHVLFATAWHTVRSVLECPESKGQKCYLIQGYETWQGSKEMVDATWRSPLRKVVITKWLGEIGRSLGAEDLTYIPNAIDHRRYRIINPVEKRPRRVCAMFSRVELKGSADAIRALEAAKQQFPDLEVTLFAVTRRERWIPEWMSYVQDPAQDYIVEHIYNQSAIVMSSSWTEGFALPPAEGAACGCAVVSTDSGGIRDFVEHEVTGLLSPPKDPEALATNLCRLLQDDDLRIRLAHAANRVIATFTWARSMDLMEEFLARTVDRVSLPSVPSLAVPPELLKGGLTSATRES